jgi:hypothetical protein
MDDSVNKSFPRVLVDEAFTRAVRCAGGVPVTDLLPDDGHSQPNADFVFQQHNVVAELKRLVKDHTEDKAVQVKLQRLYDKWVAQGKVSPGEGRIKLRPANLPPDCANEMISLFREPFANRIRKANKQIKTTKKALNMGSAIGILIVAQDGEYSMVPKDILSFLARCLNREVFSGINNVVYVNANMPLTRPNDARDLYIWAEAFRDKTRSAPNILLQSLADAWASELANAAGGRPMGAFKGTSDLLDNLEFPKAPR